MNLKTYLNIYALLKQDTSSKKERRAFGLSHVLLQHKPFDQLIAWLDAHNEELARPLLSEKFTSYLYSITFIIVLICFVLGIFSAVTLLSYHGNEPVNVIYFMAMIIALPLLTMILTILSMFKTNHSQSVLIHISPAYWLEKILSLLPNKIQKELELLKINPRLANWIVIKRSQLVALFFSVGLLLGLILVVVTKDIAFSWSTTLQVTPEGFHDILYAMAYPWHTLVPSAIPSLELIEQSQYFRLGDTLSIEMISNASKLGEWWKFLAMATLFYAITLRVLMYVFSSIGLKMAVKKSLLAIEGVSLLLRDMNEPIISTHALGVSTMREQQTLTSLQNIMHLDTSYDVVQGWAMSKKELMVLNDSMKVIAPLLFDVGGTNTLDEDIEIIHKSHGEVLLYVKIWEPPTMDFMDYLEELVVEVDKVIVMPVGTGESGYATGDKFMAIWERKLATYNNNKVWLKA